MELIDALQTDEWWQDVTLLMLEQVRTRLRALVPLIERRKRKLLFTDFEDEMGAESVIELPGFAAEAELVRFRDKARAFLRANENHVTIKKLRTNRQLTSRDLEELERMM